MGSMYRRPDGASQEDQIRRHRAERDEKAPPAAAVFQNGEELFYGTRDNGGVEMHLVMNIDYYDSLTNQMGLVQLKGVTQKQF
uniref:Lipoprotein n=1 Tax=Haemonchus contortus TaxID=6289 RepID=A0A7I4Z5Y3_HAECO|nr:unnamed protein product [Haemonchus contortus]